MAPLDARTDQGSDHTDIHRRRFEGVRRDYTAADVERLRGSVRIRHTLAEMGARRLWELLHSRDYVPALGAQTGAQAVQWVKGGARGHLPVRLAGGGRRQPGRPDLP